MNIAERVQPARTGKGLVLRCLGRFRLENATGGQPLPRTRKARAFLAALALSGRPLSRETLADLLWSDRGPAQARSSVRQSIFELQRLTPGDLPMLAVSRDEVSLRREFVAVDLELIRAAAGNDDWATLLALLEGSEPGLLTDLDGLDPEFDDWLRNERAHEPSKTFGLAVASADRCLADAGPRAAASLVGEILRLDPANEEAARLALAIDHRLGDSAALHRHYASLRDRLRDDYGAEPSPETRELFGRLAAATEPPEAEAAPGDRSGGASERTGRSRWPFAAGVVALLLTIAAAIWALSPNEKAQPAADGEPILLAVLPFEQQPRGDGFLAEGLWEDTRTALSQNSGLQVLGRATTRAMAERRIEPAQYRSRLGVDYLLEASVRQSGEQVLVSASLTRTSDGVSIWEDRFSGRIGNPLALQEAVARGIEGRLRGRLARGGGKRAGQIATSPQVYALYSEARILLRQRGKNDARRADRLLRKAVALDPNFAPAWASLASAAHFANQTSTRHSVPREQAMGYIHHAIDLAPNLAEAHAAIGLIAGPSARESGPALERALALDPGNAEAWNWLGNVRNRQSRFRDAASAYDRAVDIDPLFYPAVDNLAELLADTGDLPAARRLLARLRTAGADRGILALARAKILTGVGDYSAAAGELLPLPRELTGWTVIGEVLFRLGYVEEAVAAWRQPAMLAPVLRGKSVPPDELIGRDPAAFWQHDIHVAYAGRAMVNLGRGDRLVSLYRTAFETPDDFVEAATESGVLEVATPNLSLALRDSGYAAGADFLLAATVDRLDQLLTRAPDNRLLLWQLGTVRAAQGRRDDALRLLTDAANRGWLPDGLSQALDIAEEPAFRGLRGDPRFEALRKRILDHIARERAELGPVKV